MVKLGWSLWPHGEWKVLARHVAIPYAGRVGGQHPHGRHGHSQHPPAAAPVAAIGHTTGHSHVQWVHQVRLCDTMGATWLGLSISVQANDVWPGHVAKPILSLFKIDQAALNLIIYFYTAGKTWTLKVPIQIKKSGKAWTLPN